MSDIDNKRMMLRVEQGKGSRITCPRSLVGFNGAAPRWRLLTSSA